ncbi:MAG: Nif3-like dinuclear metal center hexameric protein [Duncaniella sp.]|uniref:Nif3-like dinuclear metal center hexameric protein n=1 Tax=Duncaniella sp. TaxID=2518496 RepID=UPI0023CC1CA7|nr:Nif3-like dinuclear metal center hexameric protein [Duncaniella sp.]MDE5987962.1 Nif3-like dinuclear metal center hexameric protein [Duncaniella sp.]
MTEPKICEITECIEAFAPRSLQEKWDNTGWQLRPASELNSCTGVMFCLDVTPAVVDEAVREGCNLIVSHHPLLFHGLKQISPDRPNQLALLKAIRHGIYIYSSHTALDNAPAGVSHRLGEMLGLMDIQVLSPRQADPSTGLGVIGDFHCALPEDDFLRRVKEVYRAESIRVSDPDRASRGVQNVALCSGSGGEFIPDAIAAGADAYITSDVRYHDFVDFGHDILIVDVGHFESEICTKSIFSAIVSEKFPNFAVRQSCAEHNPVRYV